MMQSRAKRRGLIVSVVASLALVAVAAPSASAYEVAFKSLANGKYVSEYSGDPQRPLGPLRASATKIGFMERFDVWFTDLNSRSFGLIGTGRGRTNRFVSTALNLTGRFNYAQLLSSAPKIGPWETFIAEPATTIPPRVETSNLPAKVRLKNVANNKYVLAELGYKGASYGLLRANSMNPRGPWEQFEMICVDRRGPCW